MITPGTHPIINTLASPANNNYTYTCTYIYIIMYIYMYMYIHTMSYIQCHTYIYTCSITVHPVLFQFTAIQLKTANSPAKTYACEHYCILYTSNVHRMTLLLSYTAVTWYKLPAGVSGGETAITGAGGAGGVRGVRGVRGLIKSLSLSSTMTGLSGVGLWRCLWWGLGRGAS